MTSDLAPRIHAELSDLEPDAQRQVLEYVRALKRWPKGMSGIELKEHIGTISAADAKSMIETIEAGCEQVNLDEW